MNTSDFERQPETNGSSHASPRPVERVRVLPRTLSEDQLAAVESCGQRFRSELARLVRALPADSRSVRTMASRLGIDRNTCQRVIAATQPSLNGSEAFVRLPGVKPLRELIACAKEQGIAVDLVESLTAALEQLTTIIEEFDESHVRLKSRIEATLAAGAYQADRGEMDIRQSLYEEQSRLLSRRMRVHSLITAIGPHADDATKYEQAWVRGLIGLRMGKGAAPLPLGIASTDRELKDAGPAATFNPLSRPTAPGVRNAGLIEAFSSKPLPTLTTRGPVGSQVSVLDPSHASDERGVDVAIATRISHVAKPERGIFHTSAVMLTPTQRFVFDVYLHRTLAMASVPACGAFQYTMSFSDDIEENWPFRLPGQYKLELLGVGLANSGSEAWARHRDAAAHLFAQTGWSPADYVGHRMEVEFPLWGATMYQWFDFRTTAPEDAKR